MYQLDNKGYQPSTSKEILENLTNDVKQAIPNFDFVPQELRGNLLAEGAVFEVYVENLLTPIFNFSSPSLANQTFFEFFANERGLRRKGAYKSQVDLKFSGEAGTLIPKGLEVTTQEGGITYKTFEETFIPSTGEVLVLAYSDSENIPAIGIGDLNKLVLTLPLTVTNTSEPTQPQDEETFEEFKKEAQARWRNPKNASYEGLLNALTRIEGVDNRSVGYRLKEVTENGKTYDGINILIGGGDPLEIAQAIYKNGGLIAKKYVSQPSGGETSRTISQNLIIYGNTHTYNFTRPKQINLGIKVNVSFVSISASSQAIAQLTKEKMTNYINSLPVGSRINPLALEAVFLEGLALAGGKPTDLNGDITFELSNGATAITLDSNNFFLIEFDWLLTLSEYAVNINQ